MRIALLAITEPAVAGQTTPRGFLRVAGASLAQHQLGLAIALDCQRVICLARHAYPELESLRTVAENAGLQFVVADTAHRLSALVTGRDELVVVSEGLFADPAIAERLLAQRVTAHGQAVLVQPVEQAVVAGFERIDINRASAGLMRISAKAVERLHDLPADVEVTSALTRIALQSGVETIEIPPSARGSASWAMVRDESDANDVEVAWLNGRITGSPSAGLSDAIARFAGRILAATLLHAGNASNGASIAVVGLLAIAGVLSWFLLVLAAFACVAFASILVEFARLLRDLERQSLGQLPPAIPRADILALLRDIVLTATALAAQPMPSPAGWTDWFFVPVSFILLLSLAPRLLPMRVSRWCGDRFLISLILACAAAVGQVKVAIEIMILAGAVAALILPRAHRD